MKKLFFCCAVATTLVLLTCCNKIIFRKIDCRDFELSNEYYWFPESVGDSVVFTSSLHRTMTLKITDKSITHTTRYTSDTGCGCRDWSGIFLTDGVDSMWFYNTSTYVEKDDKSLYEDAIFIVDHEQSYFNETNRTILPSYAIDTLNFTNVKMFEYSYTKPSQVKQVYMVENLGVVQFKTVNGEVWTNANLTQYARNTRDLFKYSENICD